MHDKLGRRDRLRQPDAGDHVGDAHDELLLAGRTGALGATAAEAQAFADRGWTIWEEVAAALRAIEQARQQPQQQQQQAPSNNAPTVASAIADVSGLEAGDTRDVSLSGVFDDADGDSLTITATSSDTAKVTVTVASDGSGLTLSGVAGGTATVTVTARDAGGNTVSDEFQVGVVKRYAALIATMYDRRDNSQWSSYQSHTDRWDRALLAFGETVADKTLTPMTAAEAQAFADRGWTIWEQVARALKEIEDG